MDSSMKRLLEYRLEKAEEELNIAKTLLGKKYFAKSLNSSYYSMFHATRALLAIKKVDSKRHSGVIKMFNTMFIHPGEILKEYYTYLNTAFNVRIQSDYHDFYIASKEDAEKQIQNAEKFLEMIKKYLSTYLEN